MWLCPCILCRPGHPPVSFDKDQRLCLAQLPAQNSKQLRTMTFYI